MLQQITWEQLDCKQQCRVLQRSYNVTSASLQNATAAIIRKVQLDGDQAVLQYTAEFDDVQLTTLRVSENEYQTTDTLAPELKNAIDFAYQNIEKFHCNQIPQAITLYNNGAWLRKEYRPITTVGLYIPGGSAPLVSSLLMQAIPARIAGCTRIVACTPPNRSGTLSPALLYAAQRCQLDLYKAGGAQAIAAMAYGTETIPKVDKIFGPGNKYVAQAKMLVALDLNGAAFDLPAGPSEVMVIMDESADPELIASDLLAQAEHDVDARVWLITDSIHCAKDVQNAVQLQLAQLSRKNIAFESLAKGWIILVQNLATAIAIANQCAPEHLILHGRNTKKYIPLIQNAGSVFLGPWSAEAIGDYCSGPNHILPTGGFARAYSGLDVAAFMKAITFQEISGDALQQLGPTAALLAELEGLTAHEQSVRLRLQRIQREVAL